METRNLTATGANSIPLVALQEAQSQVGQMEEPIGSNSGEMVNEYLKSIGLNPGYAWCQAFVYWCYNEAAKKLSKPNPVVKTAGVHDCWNKSDKSAKLTAAEVLKNPTLLKSGDQFILSYGATTGHTGLVEKIDGIIIHTIEGNSNNTGSREGFEVVRHVRNLNDKHLLGFIKY